MSNTNITFAFFGGEPLAVPALEKLHSAGLVPKLIVTSPDRHSGRGMTLTPPPTKVWANKHNIPVIQPTSFKDSSQIKPLTNQSWDVFVVVAYNAILPKSIIDLPEHGTLNVHPSLLPALRGPSPIRSAILHNMRETGVTIMHMDEQMDHGPIVTQEPVSIPKEKWPLRGPVLDALLAEKGATLLAETLPLWTEGSCSEKPQQHEESTYTQKFSKEEGEIDPNGDAYQNYLKFCAFDGQTGTYFFTEKNGKNIRVKITDAEYRDGSFNVLRVIPEGKREIEFEKFRVS